MAIYKKLYANMDWWEVAEQPANSSKIADFLTECRSLWDNGGASAQVAIQRMEYHLRAKFLLQNNANFEEIFEVNSGNDPIEIDAFRLDLTDVDFSVSPIPLVKTEAYFSVQVKDGFGLIDLQEWQLINGFLYDAVSFLWDFRSIDAKALDLDLSFGNNSGAECICLE